MTIGYLIERLEDIQRVVGPDAPVGKALGIEEVRLMGREAVFDSPLLARLENLARSASRASEKSHDITTDLRRELSKCHP